MDKRITALAVGLPLVTAGCFATTPLQELGGIPSGNNQVIDLSSGIKAKPGYGSVTLKVSGLPVTRTTQSVSTGMYLVVAVTDKDHKQLKDIETNDAVYGAAVGSNGIATITLPPLPNTSGATSLTPGTPTGDIFSTFLFPSNPLSATPVYSDLASYSADVGGGTYATWDKLYADQDKTGNALKGSGEVTSDVLPGFPVSVTLQNWFHITGDFDPASATAAYLSISGFTLESPNTLRLRHPGLKSTQFQLTGSDNYGRIVVNGTATAATPKVKVETVDNTSPNTAAVAVTGFGTATDLTKMTPAQLLGTATQTSTFWADVNFKDMSGANGKVADFTFTSLAAGQVIKFLSRDTTGAFSNDTGNNTFN